MYFGGYDDPMADDPDKKPELEDEGADSSEEKDESEKKDDDDLDFFDGDDPEIVMGGEMAVVLDFSDGKISVGLPSEMGTEALERMLDVAVQAFGKLRVQIQ